MIRVSRLLVLLMVGFTAVVIPPRHAHALWGRDGIRIASGDVQSVVACADAAGGAYAAWWSWPGDIRAIRFQADGSVASGWPATGLVVAAHDQGTCLWEPPQSVRPDGLGGAIVSYLQSCSGGFASRYFARLDPDGSIAAGWPKAFDTGVASAYLAGAPDGVGGVYAAWIERVVGGQEPVWVQRLLPDGTPAWPKKFLGLAELSYPPAVVDDGSGGVVVTWPCQAWSVDPSGVDLWDLAVPACGTVVTPVVTPDGAGGVFIAWSNASDIRVIRLTDGSPSPGWPDDGVDAGTRATDLGPQADFGLTPDGLGGVFVTSTNTFAEKRVQHVTGDGHIVEGWLSIGGPRHGRLVPDAQGGWYDVWAENKTGQPGGVDLFALHYDYNMLLVPGWTGNGSPISLKAGSPQSGPAGVTDGAGGFFAVWADTGLYGQHVEADEAPPLAVGPATTPLRLGLAAAPNPARGVVQCALSLPATGTARLEVFDLFGRRVGSQVIDVLEPGTRSVRIDTRTLRSGVYSIRLTQAGRTATTRAIVAR